MMRDNWVRGYDGKIWVPNSMGQSCSIKISIILIVVSIVIYFFSG